MKRCLVITVLALVALPLPAGGLAAPSTVVTPTWNFYTAPIDAGHGYTLATTVSKTGASASVTFSFVKKRGAASQEHDYFFTMHTNDFNCSSSLSTCSVNTGRELKRYGMLKMIFRPKGRGMPVKPPTGCTGTDTDRTGTLVGNFDLRATKKFFHRLRRRLLKGTANLIQLDCAPPKSFCHTTQLSSFSSIAYMDLVGDRLGRSSGSLAFTDPAATTAPAIVSRIIRITNMRSANFSFAPDLSSATFSGNGLPWLSGSITYTASGPEKPSSSVCGPGSYTSGGINSTVRAIFDGVGRKSFPPSTTAFFQFYP